MDAVATAGNAFTIKASITEPATELRPGMTAQVSFTVADNGPENGQAAGYRISSHGLLTAAAPKRLRLFIVFLIGVVILGVQICLDHPRQEDPILRLKIVFDQNRAAFKSSRPA